MVTIGFACVRPVLFADPSRFAGDRHGLLVRSVGCICMSLHRKASILEFRKKEHVESIQERGKAIAPLIMC